LGFENVIVAEEPEAAVLDQDLPIVLHPLNLYPAAGVAVIFHEPDPIPPTG